MTATEILRRMLDERGVEYETYIEQPTGFEHVKWNFNDHGSADFNLEFGEPWLTMYGVISGPEQAIAATLGSCNCSNNCTNGERTETCHIDLVGYNQREDRFQCRSCDWYMWFKRGTWPQFNYCPNCGRRCVG